MSRLVPFFIALSLLYTLLYAAALGYIYHLRQERIAGFKDQKIKHLQETYQLTAKTHGKATDAVFYSLIQNDKILSLFARASGAGEPERTRIRKKLLSRLQAPYNVLHDTLQVRQLHFHLPDNTSFLRFHRPDKYGDDLTKIRESVRLANSTKRFVSGFEEGKIFNGFRYVYPLFYENSHIGSVEISLPFGSMKQMLNSVYNVRYDFIIKGSVVHKKVFDDEMDNYRIAPYYPGYMIETHGQPATEDIGFMRRAMKENVKGRLDQENSFVMDRFCTKSQKQCIATFLSIKNMKNEHTAYLIAMEESDAITILKDRFVFQALLLSFIFAVLPVGAYLLYLIKTRKAIRKKARTDYLTGALNRHGCGERLNALLQGCHDEDKGFGVILFDIDYFKKINDTYGHDVGDLVLKELIDLVHERIRNTDILCRWGGEEFLLLLPGADYKATGIIADKLCKRVKNHNFTAIDSLTVSMGYTQAITADDKDSAVKRADEGLYAAKEGGRDRCVGKEG